MARNTAAFSTDRVVHAANAAVTLRHHARPYSADALGANVRGYRRVVENYLQDVRGSLGLKKSALQTLNSPFSSRLMAQVSRLKFAGTKTVGNTRTVFYQHTFLGLAVWREGVSVRMFKDRLDVVSSSSRMPGKVDLPSLDLDWQNPESEQSGRALQALKQRVGRSRKELETKVKQFAEKYKVELESINKVVPTIYYFELSQRIDDEHQDEKPKKTLDKFGHGIRLPKLSDDIKDNSYRLCHEVFFSVRGKRSGAANWRAMFDVQTSEILYLRANTQALDGLVFKLDPERISGDPTITPASPATDLDPLRESVELLGLTAPAAGQPQALDGEFVSIQDTDTPTIAPPSEPSGTDFAYSTTTDDFTAVNAYYHMDSLYRMVDDFGLDTSTYFAGTTFPISVDHRGVDGDQNAFHWGDDATASTTKFTFGLLAGSAVGYAVLRAAAAHEFAHSCLQNNIGDGVFSWCHGFGDALGVVLCDPESNAPDRFARNPFMTSGAGTRRHDRLVTDGWAWGGTRDVSGFLQRRQIMSTSMFRAYQCTGGDSIHGNPTVQLERRAFASRYMSYLMLGGVGTMNSVVPPASAVDFETAVMDFDKTNPDFEGHPGGAFHKVVRWAFEKQGLHKLPGDPVDGEGAPPAVDVYIDDGRDGEYEYQRNFWNTTDIWSSQINDSTVGHQTPLVGVTNYFFCRVKNRGQDTANNMQVDAYQCIPGTGLTWPTSWTPMDTPSVVVGTLAAGAEVIVGPFEWTPTTVDHECLLASVTCDEDPSNADTVLGDVPHWRLVPFDNNIAQRNVSPELPESDGLTESLTDRVFWVNNPYKRPVTAELEVELPDFLKERGWQVKFNSTGGTRVKLEPNGRRKVSFTLVPGKKFDKQDVPKRGAQIDIMTSIENQLVGGMTYSVNRKTKPDGGTKRISCVRLAQKLVECLGVSDKQVTNVKIKGNRIQLKFEDD